MPFLRQAALWAAPYFAMGCRSMVVLLLMAIPGFAQQPPSFSPHFDTIPNFAENFTVETAQAGAWSNTSTWVGGSVPGVNDIVLIAHAVTYASTTGDVHTIGLDSGGTLTFATDQNTTLRVGTLLVMPSGTLQIGTVGNPIGAAFTAEIIYNDQALDTVDDASGVFDPFQFGTGLLVYDGTLQVHGAAKVNSFVGFSAETVASATTIPLATAVPDWNIGDAIAVPDTRQLLVAERKENYVGQWEERTITAKSPDNLTLTLSSALTYAHAGARDAVGTLVALPHVGNRTRNVIFRSENPAGTRAHSIFFERAVIDIRYAVFKEMGRTTIEVLNSTVESPPGTFTIGTNQIARYPIHMHHLYGPVTTPSNGYQYTFVGNVVDGGSFEHNKKGGVVVHDSQYGLLQNNFLYNTAGAGFVTEQGSETQNLFDANFVLRVSGPGGRADNVPQFFGQGTGYWARSPNDSYTNNVAANCGADINNFGYVFYLRFMDTQSIPMFKGEDPFTGGTVTDMYTVPLRQFDNNQVYGATDSGMTTWWINFNYETPQGGGQTTINDLLIWHVHRKGYWNYQQSDFVFNRMKIYGDPNNPFGDGLFLHDYFIHDTIFRDLDIQGMEVGVRAPVSFVPGSPDFTIEDSHLQNKININVEYLWDCCTVPVASRRLVFRNIDFDQLGSHPLLNIDMDWIQAFELPSKHADLVELSQVVVEDYDGQVGVDFQVYFLEQAPDTIMLQSGFNIIPGGSSNQPDVIGSPVVGLTNTQNLATHGVAYAGEIAPCSDTSTYPEISGFVCNIAAPNVVAPGAVSGIRIVD